MSWQEVRLKQVCELIDGDRGKNYPSNGELSSKGDCLFLNTGNVTKSGFNFQTCQFITREKDAVLRKGKLENGDIVITTRGTIGHVAMYSEVIPYKTVRINSGMLILKSGEQLDSRFLYYVIQSRVFQATIDAIKTGSAQPQLPVKNLKEIKIPLPPLYCQQRIAGILSAYDDLIENNRKQIKLLEEAAQRLYKEWFVDLKFPGHENTPIHDGVPEGWRKERSSEFFDIAIGKTPPRKETQWFSTVGVPWASVSDLGKCNAYILETAESLTADAVERFHVKVAPVNSILLSFKMTIGRVAITPFPMATNEAIAHFVTEKGELIPYAYEYLKNFEYSKLGSTSSISTAINSKIVKAIPFLLPPDIILNLFNKHVKAMFSEIKNCQLAVLAAREARDRLLPKLMSGELEV